MKMTYFSVFRGMGFLSLAVVSIFLIQGYHYASLSCHQLDEIMAQLEEKYTTVNHIETERAAQWLARFPNTIVLDIREEEEFAVSHLRNAYHVPPNTSLKQVVSTVLKDVSPEETIIVYCSVGFRSAEFAQKLAAIGYQNVYNLKGSVFAWVNEGRPVYQGNKRVNKVHPFNEKWGGLLLPEYRGKV